MSIPPINKLLLTNQTKCQILKVGHSNCCFFIYLRLKRPTELINYSQFVTICEHHDSLSKKGQLNYGLLGYTKRTVPVQKVRLTFTTPSLLDICPPPQSTMRTQRQEHISLDPFTSIQSHWIYCKKWGYLRVWDWHVFLPPQKVLGHPLAFYGEWVEDWYGQTVLSPFEKHRFSHSHVFLHNKKMR